MNILTISNSPLVESQGSGYAILNYCRGMIELGHSVDYYGPEDYEPFYNSMRGKHYRQAIGMLFFTLKKLGRNFYDIVEFYGAEAWLTILVLRRFYRNKPLLVSHSNGIEPHVYETLYRHLGEVDINGFPKKWYQLNQSRLYEIGFRNVDGVVTVSNFDSDYVLEKNYVDSKMVVAVNHGLPSDFLNIDIDLNRKPVIGYCGSWIARKGINILTTDLANILAEFPEVSLKMIGVGRGFNKHKYFPSSVCDQINVIPFVENKKELRTVYQALSIMIVPSIYESFGLVIAEAMACGCAVVASKTGFADDLQDRKEAMIIKKLKSPYLYESVKELLLNDTMRWNIAKAGSELVQKLVWTRAVKKLEETYINWLNMDRNFK